MQWQGRESRGEGESLVTRTARGWEHQLFAAEAKMASSLELEAGRLKYS